MKHTMPPDVMTFVSEMISHNIQFSLTGSKFFDTATAFSDWDFFIPNTGKNEQTLLNLGFVNILPNKYDDILTSKVYRKGNIDVQLVNDYFLKYKANLLLKSCPMKPVVDKRLVGIMWNWAYRVADCISIELLQIVLGKEKIYANKRASMERDNGIA